MNNELCYPKRDLRPYESVTDVLQNEKDDEIVIA